MVSQGPSHYDLNLMKKSIKKKKTQHTTTKNMGSMSKIKFHAVYMDQSHIMCLVLKQALPFPFFFFSPVLICAESNESTDHLTLDRRQSNQDNLE